MASSSSNRNPTSASRAVGAGLTILDRMTAYATRVCAGEIPASRLVVAVCRRHLLDLERLRAGGWWCYWDEAKAADACHWIMRNIVIYDKLRRADVRLRLLPWQVFLIGTIFGWRIAEGVYDRLERLPHTRRIRKATLLTGRGTGKSVLAAAILCYLAFRDNRRLDGYLISGTEQQASIILNHVISMVGHNPAMASVAHVVKGSSRHGGSIELTDRSIGLRSEIRTLAGSGKGKKKSGFHPSVIVADELQEHDSGRMRNIMEAGFADEPEPLSISTCNAGDRRQGAWWDDRMRATRLAADIASRDHDDYLPMIYEVDDDDKPTEQQPDDPGEYTDSARRSWIKANPSIRYIVQPGRLKAAIAEARHGDTGAWRELMRAQFSRSPFGRGWLKDHQWAAIVTEERPAQAVLDRSKVFLGLDLAAKSDFTALAVAWRLDAGLWAGLPDGGLYIEVTYYSGADGLAEKGQACQADFIRWAAEGVIRTSPDALLDYGIVARDLIALKGQYSIYGIAADRAEMDALEQAIRAEGETPLKSDPLTDSSADQEIVWSDHLQGGKWMGKGRLEAPLTMRKALRLFEGRALRRTPTVQIRLDPCTSFCYTCAHAYRPTSPGQSEENRWIQKATYGSDRERVDGIHAILMATCLADFQTDQTDWAALRAAYAERFSKSQVQ